MRGLLALGLVLGLGIARAEVGCFRTAAQAAVQFGEQEGGGYRLEFVRHDVFSGRSWAMVRSCAHPEWPPVAIGAEFQRRAVVAVVNGTTPKSVPWAVTGGGTVKVIDVDPMARIEMSGVAQANGAVGDWIWVRLLGPTSAGVVRMVQGIVRGKEWVEVNR
jgi:hypothetical protein